MDRRLAYLSAASLGVVLLVELWVHSFLDHASRVRSARLHVILIIELVMLACAMYVWKRLAVLFGKGSAFFFVGFLCKALLFVVLCFAMLTWPLSVFIVQSDPPLINTVSATCFGLVVFLSTALNIADVTSFLLRKVLCRHVTARGGLKDTTEMKIRVSLAVLCAIGLACAGRIGFSEGAVVERVAIPVAGLDARLNGTTIIQLSDIHLGPFNGRDSLQSVVDKVDELNADVVVITGDLVDSSVAALRQVVKPLARLRSKLGVFYTTGNHEYYTGDVDGWLAELPKFNVTPLVNERVCLMTSDPSSSSSCRHGFYLAGLEDIETRRLKYGDHSMDIHSALSGRERGIPTVVMAHQPWAAVEAMMWDDVRLVLSGHTHGGQLFPFAVPVYLYNPMFAGLYQPRPGVYVYVSPGTGYYLTPFRHYRPEITVLTLLAK